LKTELVARQDDIKRDKPDSQRHDRPSSFTLETAEELARKASLSVSQGFPGNLIGDERNVPESHLLLLRDLSTPSLLIEQGLKRYGHHIEACQYPDKLLLEIESGGFDMVLFDYSLPIPQRLSVVKKIRDVDPSIPIVLVINPNAEHEAIVAKTESVTECIVQDGDGAYLFKITDLVRRLLTERSGGAASQRSTPSEDPDDITDRVDLSSIAQEVKGAIIASQKAALVVLAGVDVGSVVQLDNPVVLIGRDSSCNMTLKDDSISRFHASIKLHQNGVVTIEDLNSTNGTYVNGKQVQIEELREGDKILLGKNTVIKYQTQDSIERNYYDELYFSSTRDELTRLYNRRSCMEKIKTDLSYAKRHGLPVSIIMFDVDHFKKINDSNGHLAGDLVLSTIARLAQSAVRQEDILGRYGGEEFLVFALDTGLDGAMVLAERIRQKIEREDFIVDKAKRRVLRATVSLGVASISANKAPYDIKKLISLADENLYRAKNSGRNCIEGSLLTED
jgi:two-component system, cell cycle response regulator